MSDIELHNQIEKEAVLMIWIAFWYFNFHGAAVSKDSGRWDFGQEKNW